MIDRQNYHTFQPLLYQVATAGLSPGEIAAPIRSIFVRIRISKCSWRRSLDSISNAASLQTADAEIPYDYLIVAAGASHAYFGHDDWEPFAPGLKTIEDALEIRRRVLLAFELAERQAAAGETAESAQLSSLSAEDLPESNWQALSRKSATTLWPTNFAPSIPGTHAHSCWSKADRGFWPPTPKIFLAARRHN